MIKPKKSKFIKECLSIGTWVEVDTFAKYDQCAHGYNFKKGAKIVGQITGGKHLLAGALGLIGWGEVGWAFKSETNYFVYAIRKGFTNKEVYARPQDVKVCEKQDGNLPFRAKEIKLSDKERESLSEIMQEEMRDWPRDEKGRWKKKTS